jgi:hypothetical protein
MKFYRTSNNEGVLRTHFAVFLLFLGYVYNCKQMFSSVRVQLAKINQQSTKGINIRSPEYCMTA